MTLSEIIAKVEDKCLLPEDPLDIDSLLEAESLFCSLSLENNSLILGLIGFIQDAEFVSV